MGAASGWMDGQWDGGSVVPAHAFVNVGEHSYLYYGAWDNGLCFETAAGDVGMAFWRRDGFGYVRIREGDKASVLGTEVIDATGREQRILVNFDIQAYNPGCGLDFELVDQSGRVLKGYSAGECVRCVEPGLAQPVRWKEHEGIGKEIKEPVELRVYFRTNGDSNPYQPEPSSPMLYCVYLLDEGESL